MTRQSHSKRKLTSVGFSYCRHYALAISTFVLLILLVNGKPKTLSEKQQFVVDRLAGNKNFRDLSESEKETKREERRAQREAARTAHRERVVRGEQPGQQPAPTSNDEKAGDDGDRRRAERLKQNLNFRNLSWSEKDKVREERRAQRAANRARYRESQREPPPPHQARDERNDDEKPSQMTKSEKHKFRADRLKQNQNYKNLSRSQKDKIREDRRAQREAFRKQYRLKNKEVGDEL